MNSENLALCVALRHELHAHPELSGCETWTKWRLMDFLREHTSLKLFDHGYFFYALYQGKSAAPAIAFRADFDALPIEDEIDAPHRSQCSGVGHKCGHDGHSATLCALALEVEHTQPERSVVFLFQPAEETGEGAKSCLDVFKEQNISEFYAYHNYPSEPFKTVSLKKGTICLTSKGLSLFFKGKTAHASQPENGINPAYTIAKLIQKIEQIQSDDSLFDDFIRCTIVNVQVGEAAFGVAAGDGVLRLTIRAYHDHDLAKLERVIVEAAQEMSEQQGIAFHTEEQDYFPATVNDDGAVDKIWASCQAVGQPIKELPEFFRASEDFGYFLQNVRGAMLFIGNGENAPPLHTYNFDFPDDLIEVGVKTFMSLIQSEQVL
ncbi:amidohydrolase [Kingella negevensis]|uniref:Putative hydrolase YxeP n=1 Tax=Kingella negevensis TaxID=1522312 RepID=A0A238TCH4_9NEIS|nr:amidohydrolase [Kingella negevensis]MDK4679550.1 amidohydrolase [Kingella negevensis]MDK4682732.1 amidohydrolase [Kingella negevensis]MDK4685477.1 amidohydrolase [Kingella negevensis]MDK4690929.1 amidohydrolase [Kingella negevensis]MDK4693924.1 amidohydrolase [Kingella negevensis]